MDYILYEPDDYSVSASEYNIYAKFDELVNILGQPNKAPLWKTSTTWIFKVKQDNDEFLPCIFGIYDWKQTSLYNEEYPSIEEFRRERNWYIIACSRDFTRPYLKEMYSDCVFRDLMERIYGGK